MNPKIRDILIWALLPVGLVLIGVVNYFTGSLSKPAQSDVAVARLDFRTDRMQKAYRSSVLLRLAWGAKGVARAEDSDGLPISTLEAIVAEKDGTFLLVDHPPSNVGARVRRYSRAGSLLDTILTPAGSTLFTSIDGVLAYVVAKQSGANETLVLADGSRETTYAVPLSINSGSILSQGDDVWVTATRTVFDAEKQEVTASEVAVPVVRDGEQVTDDQAQAMVQEGWYSVGDVLYGREQIVVGAGEGARISQSLRRESDGRELEIPGRSTPLGVDSNGLIYVRVEPESLEPAVRRLPATFGAQSPVDEVLVGGLDGIVLGRLAIPGRVPTVGGWSRLDVSEHGEVLAAISDVSGVRIVRYEAVDPDE